MTKKAKREARQRRAQARKDSKVSGIRFSMSSEELADVERRGVSTDDLLLQYVYETQEVRKATKRLVSIDRAISEMSPEQQEARENRLAAQKRAALTGEDLYLLSNDAYDAWAAGVLPTV